MTVSSPEGSSVSDYWQGVASFQHDEILKRIDIQANLAQSAIRAMMLANGASMISLLTFIGNGGTITNRSSLTIAFVAFGIGLSTNLLCYFTGFFSQANLMNSSAHQMYDALLKRSNLGEFEIPKRFQTVGNCLVYGTAVLLMTSLICFCTGIFLALDAIT